MYIANLCLLHGHFWEKDHIEDFLVKCQEDLDHGEF